MKKIAKKASSVKRSRAAKKGWETRRKNAESANRASNTGEDNSVSAGNSRARTAKRTVRDNRALEKARAKLAAEKKAFRAKQKTFQGEQKKARARESRERTAIRKAHEKEQIRQQKARELAIVERKKIESDRRFARAAHLAMEKTITKMAYSGIPVPVILQPYEGAELERAKAIVVQAKLDRAVMLWNDVRWEAFDLAEELDWDISDIYDAWDYTGEQ